MNIYKQTLEYIIAWTEDNVLHHPNIISEVSITEKTVELCSR